MPAFPAPLENFLTRFAAGAGSQWRWVVLRDHRLRMEDVGWLHCPLTAQLILENGKHSHADPIEVYWLEEVYGLDAVTVQVVLHAADDTWEENPLVRAVRQRLLAICGLEETA